MFMISTKTKNFRIKYGMQAFAIFDYTLGKDRFPTDVPAHAVTIDECFKVLEEIGEIFKIYNNPYLAYNSNLKRHDLLEDLSENGWQVEKHTEFEAAIGCVIEALATAARVNDGAPVVIYWE